MMRRMIRMMMRRRMTMMRMMMVMVMVIMRMMMSFILMQMVMARTLGSRFITTLTIVWTAREATPGPPARVDAHHTG